MEAGCVSAAISETGVLVSAATSATGDDASWKTTCVRSAAESGNTASTRNISGVVPPKSISTGSLAFRFGVMPFT